MNLSSRRVVGGVKGEAGDERTFIDVVIYTDGASRGNPGPAGAGWRIESPAGEKIEEGSLALAEATNNIAEYRAVIAALERARALGARTVTLRSDSELLVRQLTGRYQVRSAGLRPLYERILELRHHFERLRFEHVPRERNARADELATRAAGRGAGESAVRDVEHTERTGEEREGGERSVGENEASEGEDPPGRVHVLSLRVRYSETDQMGFAYYARYLDWFTEARTETMREGGIPYREMEKAGILLPVREVGCEYLQPVRYDDELAIYTRITRLTPVRLDFAYTLKVRQEGTADLTIFARGWTKHAFIDASGQPFNLRKRHAEIWTRIEKAAAAFGARSDQSER